MRYFSIILITLAAFFSGCNNFFGTDGADGANGLNAQWGNYRKIKGDGNIQTQSRKGSGFTGIKACCSMKVIVAQGETYSIEVETDANLQEYVLTQVGGGTLTIKKADKVSLNPTQRTTIYVTTPEVDRLKSSSSSDIICQGGFTGRDLELDVSSSGNIEVEWSGEEVDIESSSSGKITLTGKANRLRFDGSSSSKVDARDFRAVDVDAEASSSARLTVNVSGTLDADVSSSGKVFYSGDPRRVNTDTSSGGKVSQQ